MHPRFLTRVTGDRHDRITHLVLLDGRLVDSWSEPVEHTAWAELAERYGRLSGPQEPSPARRMLAWLTLVTGDAAALDVLHGRTLEELPSMPPGPEGSVGDEHLRRAAALLDDVADRWFPAADDAEVRVLLRRCLLRAAGLGGPARGVTPAHTAGGVVWVVGRANALIGPGRRCTQQDVARHLGLAGGALSSSGRRLQRHLSPRTEAGWLDRPREAPDVDLLGHPDLLLAPIRRRLVELRDLARLLAEDPYDGPRDDPGFYRGR